LQSVTDIIDIDWNFFVNVLVLLAIHNKESKDFGRLNIFLMSNLAKKLAYVVGSVVALKLVIGATLRFSKPDQLPKVQNQEPSSLSKKD